MASANPASRSRSRHNTPATPQRNGAMSRNDSQQQESGRIFVSRWVEPPLANPQPSWREHRGVEETAVVSGMYPLGTMPPNRLRPRGRADVQRRPSGGRNLGSGLVGQQGNMQSAPRSPVTNLAIDPALQDQIQETALETSASTQAMQASSGSSILPSSTISQSNPTHIQTPPPQIQIASNSTDNTPSAHDATTRNSSPFVKAMQETEARGKSGTDRALKTLRVFTEHDQEFASLLAAVSTKNPTQVDQTNFNIKLIALKRAIRSSTGTPHRAHMASDPVTASGNTQDLHNLSTSSPRLIITNNTHNKNLDQDSQNLTSTPSNMNLRSTRAKSNRTPPVDPQMPSSTPNKRVRHSSSSSLSSVDEDVAAGPSPSPYGKNSRAANNEAMDTADDPALTGVIDKYNSNLENGVQAKESSERPSLKRKATQDLQAESSDPRIKLRVKQHNAIRNGLVNGTLRSSASHVETEADPSRAPTPTALGRPPKRMKQQAAATVKISPMKKKSTGLVAGGSAEIQEPQPEDPNLESPSDADHADFCSACNGEGTLLCCDGCTRAFHHRCIDPPMEQDAIIDENWYCYVCEAKKNSRSKEHPGLFSELLDALDKRNPTSFLLPQSIRDHFVDVGTNARGEYVDKSNVKPNRRGNQSEPVDTTKQRDRNGKLITCYACSQTSWNKRELVRCDYCQNYWHFDCIDPPITHLIVRPDQKWMCPNHTAHDMKRLDPITNAKISDEGPRYHHVRTPKNAQIATTLLPRGISNVGNVEIESENESQSEIELDDDDYYGQTLRLPPKGVKLDFISKVRASRQETLERNLIEEQRRSITEKSFSIMEHKNRIRNMELEYENMKRLSQDLTSRPTQDQQAVLALMQFAFPKRDVNLGGDALTNLLGQAIADAPPEVIQSIQQKEKDAQKTRANGGKIVRAPLSIEERQALLQLQTWIGNRLQQHDDSLQEHFPSG